MAIKSLITNKPIVVIDGIPFRFQDLESQKLLLSKAEIEKIVAIDKQKGINIFGPFGMQVFWWPIDRKVTKYLLQPLMS
jgi:tmRNA-binding protein